MGCRDQRSIVWKLRELAWDTLHSTETTERPLQQGGRLAPTPVPSDLHMHDAVHACAHTVDLFEESQALVVMHIFNLSTPEEEAGGSL